MKKQGIIFDTLEDSYFYTDIILSDGRKLHIPNSYGNLRNIELKFDLKNNPHRLYIYADNELVPELSLEYFNDEELSLIIRCLRDLIKDYNRRY